MLGSRLIWKSNIAKVGSFVASSTNELLIISLETPLNRVDRRRQTCLHSFITKTHPASFRSFCNRSIIHSERHVSTKAAGLAANLSARLVPLTHRCDLSATVKQVPPRAPPPLRFPTRRPFSVQTSINSDAPMRRALTSLSPCVRRSNPSDASSSSGCFPHPPSAPPLLFALWDRQTSSAVFHYYSPRTDRI